MKLFKKKNFYLNFIFLIFILFLDQAQSNEVKIITKINNEIITNVDVVNEYNYLIALNKNLQDLEKEKVLTFAKESLIKEKIKKYEIEKYFELNKKNVIIDNIVENIYKNLNLNNVDQFKNYLKPYQINFDDVYKKIEIETVWNQIIYEKFQNKIVINEDKLKEKITNTTKKKESILLSELVFDFENKDEINSKYEEILRSIKNIGFKETVIKFSVVDSKSNFGSLGWVDKNILSNEIKNHLKDLMVGDITKPIIIPSGVLILKLEDEKLEDLEINLDAELENIKRYETNNQLQNFSIIYYNKVKNNLSINEY